MASKGSKRGCGVCSVCSNEYSNRKKPKHCACGNFLGGSFVEKPKKAKEVQPVCVAIFTNQQHGKLSSVRVTPKGDRQFTFTKDEQKICYAKKCLELRAVYVSSGKCDQFNCPHLDTEPIDAVFSISFHEEEITKFIPDALVQEEMKAIQVSDLSTVVKISTLANAVIGKVLTASPMRYTHVKCIINENGKSNFYCTHNECKKKAGRTKQVRTKRVWYTILFLGCLSCSAFDEI